VPGYWKPSSKRRWRSPGGRWLLVVLLQPQTSCLSSTGMPSWGSASVSQVPCKPGRVCGQAESLVGRHHARRSRGVVAPAAAMPHNSHCSGSAAAHPLPLPDAQGTPSHQRLPPHLERIWPCWPALRLVARGYARPWPCRHALDDVPRRQPLQLGLHKRQRRRISCSCWRCWRCGCQQGWGTPHEEQREGGGASN